MTALADTPGLGTSIAQAVERAWRRLRVRTIYLVRHGRLPNLDQPRRFTEWVQWRKLQPSAAQLDRLTDKLWSKKTAGALAVPTLWSGTDLPIEPPGPLPLMVKANHGCGQFIAVRTMHDWTRARRLAPRWLARNYGEWLDERAYRSARRLLLVEPFLGGAGAPLPEDYKVYVFAGRAAIVQHHRGRGRNHRWTQYDRDWAPLGGDRQVSAPPANLTAMIEAAERQARGVDFLRVDFYEVDGRLWFGEYCLYPGSGLDPFDPVALDDRLGDLWAGTASTAD